MSKRSKKNRKTKPAVAPSGAKPKMRWGVMAAFALGVPLLLGLWWWNSKTVEVSRTNSTANVSSPRFQKLVGRWQRPDGGYVLAINKIATDGTMDAAYYNPQSIHVAKAEASRDGDTLKVFFELRDVNYPGSNYTLTYDPASDQLKGIYYQAVEKQRFQITFVRLK